MKNFNIKLPQGHPGWTTGAGFEARSIMIMPDHKREDSVQAQIKNALASLENGQSPTRTVKLPMSLKAIVLCPKYFHPALKRK